MGLSCELGKENLSGIRNEDLCNLTFPDEAFDQLISLDVLEHIPDYEKAFSECFRVIKKGGSMMWSVPFSPNYEKNIIRARIVDNKVIHDLPAEYHGDPLSLTEGILCFQHFGWEMIEQMIRAGFKDAYAISYISSEFGYLGGEQFMFFARK